MKGYKVFNPDWTCLGFQYKVGETFVHEGPPNPCASGFHFCPDLVDTFNYYDFSPSNKVAEIEALGEIKQQGDKCVTNKIRIVRELTWDEVLRLVNAGEFNTGRGNAGNYNTGHQNAGRYNTGDRNLGSWNTGNGNEGDSNTGNANGGHDNTGYHNKGDNNTGNRNTGNRNTGHSNTGSYNTGDHNKGGFNTGDGNTRSHNTGHFNTGHRNTGDFNSCDYSPGIFCTEEPEFMMFNKPCAMSRQAVRQLPGYLACRDVQFYMGEGVTYKEAWRTYWGLMSDGDKKRIQDLPNFDPEVFFEITGVRV